MTYSREPEFQIYQCQNQDCRFRCPTNLSMKKLDHCPLCGSTLLPVSPVFTNLKNQPSTTTKDENEIEVLLDNLRSTLNVGSIFRTADGVGISRIHLCGTTPTPEHAKIKKTGLGAEWNIPWQYHPNGLDFVISQKNLGTYIIAVETSPLAENIFDLAIPVNTNKLLLVLGNEVSGIDPDILNLSDKTINIPMNGVKSSLNVAVAFGIASYTLFDKFRKSR